MKYLKLILVLIILSGCTTKKNYEKFKSMESGYWLACDNETGIEYFVSKNNGALFVRLRENGLPKKCEQELK